MRPSPLRKRLAREAARLLYSQETDQLFQARKEAQRRLSAREAESYHLPSKEEIGEELQVLAARFPLEELDAAVLTRLTLLRVMRLLARYRPRCEQETDSPIHRIHLCGCQAEAIETLFSEEGLVGSWDATGKQLAIDSLEVVLVLHQVAQWEENPGDLPFNCWTISDLERQLATDLPAVDLYSTVGIPLHRRDRFDVYRSLLLPLEEVEQSPVSHPEGDALYHSLQVYQLVREQVPYDEELLLAALLHDVGKGIDRADHIAAALTALAGFVTERTAWLIEHHHAGLQVLDGSIGFRAHKRLRESEDYEDLLILARGDRDGCCPGVQVEEVEQVLDYLKQLAQENG